MPQFPAGYAAWSKVLLVRGAAGVDGIARHT